MNFFKKILKDWLDPAPQTWQGALGPLHERQAFEPPEPSLGELLIGYWKGNTPVYTDRPRRPIFLPDPRAEKNRQAALERAKASNETRPPIWWLSGNGNGG